MTHEAAILGAGILGLLLARELESRGWTVRIFDRSTASSRTKNTSAAAGGMLAPYSELESSEAAISEWGLRSLTLWPEILAALPEPVFYRQAGSLILSHPRDRSHADQLIARIRSQAPESAYRWVEVGTCEPELAETFSHGLLLPTEAHLDNRQLLAVLERHLRLKGVTFVDETPILSIDPQNCLVTRDESFSCDRIFDCRGSGATQDLPDLRGVRGEAFIVQAPDVSLQRPVRLMHPRYAVYIVPRAEACFYIGATALETSDDGPVTIRSTLELLSAAYSVHRGFAEARVVESLVGLRPAFSDHSPRIQVERDGRFIRMNGLYRHGFLLAPFLVEQLGFYLDDKAVETKIFTFVERS